MKNLQDLTPDIWTLKTSMDIKVIVRRPHRPQSLILLLHGLNERGLRIYRKLIRSLPSDSLVLAPNAPYPIPRYKNDRLDLGFSWYFFDKFNQTYQIDQKAALGLLGNLISEANPLDLPVTIIGFSQGGYLSPLVAYQNPSVKKIIGLGCEFKSQFFLQPPHFSIHAVHGLLDHVVLAQNALREIELLKEKGVAINWHPVENGKHEICSGMAKAVQLILES